MAYELELIIQSLTFGSSGVVCHECYNLLICGLAHFCNFFYLSSTCVFSSVFPVFGLHFLSICSFCFVCICVGCLRIFCKPLFIRIYTVCITASAATTSVLVSFVTI